MDTKKFLLILTAIVGLTIVAITFLDRMAEMQIKEYEHSYFTPLCEYRGGSFTAPRHQQHHYRPHYRQYRRPLPVKTYFKYTPPPPPRHKSKRRRRVGKVC